MLFTYMNANIVFICISFQNYLYFICSYVETLLHMIKGNVGSGVFAMGDAFRNAGLLLGPILTIFLGIICVYGNHILVNSLNLIIYKSWVYKA